MIREEVKPCACNGLEWDELAISCWELNSPVSGLWDSEQEVNAVKPIPKYYSMVFQDKKSFFESLKAPHLTMVLKKKQQKEFWAREPMDSLVLYSRESLQGAEKTHRSEIGMTVFADTGYFL
ncbi:hypothetical protein BTVI_32258 [Pitangus sulphuratus]|nr:hypothetical protein BTVI_32258 [Pitangus sulphuratus]